MASPTTRRTNGSNGHAGRIQRFDADAVRTRADQISHSASLIARVADEVAEGAQSQGRSLDEAVSELSGMTSSLVESSTQAESVSVSADELVSSMNEMAASIEQVTANATSLSSFGRRDGCQRTGNDRLDSDHRRHGRGHVHVGSGSRCVDHRNGEQHQERQPRHRGADGVDQRDGRSDRRDGAFDRRCRRQRDRSGRGHRGDRIVDQRDGRVDRGSRCDERQPGDRRRAEFDTRSNRWRGPSSRLPPMADRSARSPPTPLPAPTSSIDRFNRSRRWPDRATR